MNYEIKIVRSKRKTVCITVDGSNLVTVRCPLHLSAAKIDDFIERKKSWIDKIVSENALKNEKNNDIINYKKLYINGKLFDLVLSDKAVFYENGLYVKNVGSIKKFLVTECGLDFKNKVLKLSTLFGFNCKSVNFKSYKSRWGCCDIKGNLYFNDIIFMLAPELQDYIIVHELCHTVFFNHSKNFWAEVGKIIPDYKRIREQLKSFNYLTNLY